MKNNTHTLTFMIVLLALITSACSMFPKPAPPPNGEPNPQNTQNMPAEPLAQQPASQQSPSDKTSFSLGSVLAPVSGNYQFAEGPAADANGNVYFSDVNAGRIYKWSPDGSVSVFLEGLNMPNGLILDKSGNLIACEGGNGRLISIDSQGQITVLIDQYNGVRFNKPNDLWIDPQGGIYFTDPTYQLSLTQDGEHVYYLSPDCSQVMRVVADMVRPNGIVGATDGKTLYVTDHGQSRLFPAILMQRIHF